MDICSQNNNEHKGSYVVFRAIAIISILSLLSGCALFTRNLTKEGAKVEVFDRKPEGCKSLGIISASRAIEKKHLIFYFQNSAAEKGANSIRVKKIYKVNNRYFEGEAYAYKCQEGSTADIVAFTF